jgi:peroxiredoxin Q/BCP
MKLEIGNPAPAFSALDQNNNRHTLNDYSGRWLVLYFYPKDFTSGCTVEAQQFRDAFNKLKEKAVVVGVSSDTIDSHKQFCDKYGLQFTLLADTDKKMITDYGADGLIFTRRVSFLIDPDGNIGKIYDKVNPEIHAQEILNDLEEITK